MINKIKNCANLEKDTDAKMRLLKDHNPKIQFTEGLINSLKGKDLGQIVYIQYWLFTINVC